MSAFDRLKKNLESKSKKFLETEAFPASELQESSFLIARTGNTAVSTNLLARLSSRGVTKTIAESTKELTTCLDTLHSALEGAIMRDARAISRAVVSLADDGTTTEAGYNNNGMTFITIAADLRSMYMDTSIAYKNFDADLKFAKASADRFTLLKESGKGRRQTKVVQDLAQAMSQLEELGDKVTFEKVFKPYDDFRSTALYEAGYQLKNLGAFNDTTHEQALTYTLVAMQAILSSIKHMIKTIELATILGTERAKARAAFLYSVVFELYDNVRVKLGNMLAASDGTSPYVAGAARRPLGVMKDIQKAVKNGARLGGPSTSKDLKKYMEAFEQKVLAKAADNLIEKMEYGGTEYSAKNALTQVITDHNLTPSTVKPPFKSTF